MTVRVMIVDDHPVVRAGLRAVIVADPTIDVVGDAATGEEAVRQAGDLMPEVVLCDLRLGAGMDGVATTAALKSLDPAPAVLIVTTFDRDAEVLGAIEAGAEGYLLKDAPPAEIIKAIRTVASGRMFLSAEVAQRVVGGVRTPLPKLSSREQQVLRQVATGASNKEIARALVVSEATVKSHLVHIFAKLGADSRVRAVHIGQQRGLI